MASWYTLSTSRIPILLINKKSPLSSRAGCYTSKADAVTALRYKVPGLGQTLYKISSSRRVMTAAQDHSNPASSLLRT